MSFYEKRDKKIQKKKDGKNAKKEGGKNMKKKEAMVILILLIVTIVLVVVGVMTKNNNTGTQTANGDKSQTAGNTNEEETKDKNVVYLDDGTRVNRSEKVIKDRSMDGLKFTDIQLTEKDSKTSLILNVTNTSSETMKNVVYNAKALDSKGNETIAFSIFVAEIGAGETKQASASSMGDYANAYELRIEK